MASLLDLLFGPRNPSLEWPPYKGQPLVFDCDTSRLNGVAVGERPTEASFLGPDESGVKRRVTQLHYRSLGLAIMLHRQMIDASIFNFSAPHFGDYESFAGRFVSGGETIPLATWTEQEIIEHFGPPREIDRDDTEIILFYDRGEYEWNFELSLDSRLKCFLVVSS